MKTIQQIADELGTSKQNVYQRIKDSSFSLDDLTRIKQGKHTVFDDESEKRIKELFNNETTTSREKRRVNDTLDELKRSQEQINKLTKELEDARAKISEDQAEIARLRSVEEEQRHTIASLSESIRLKTQQETMRLEAKQPEKIGFVQRAKQLLSNIKKNI